MTDLTFALILAFFGGLYLFVDMLTVVFVYFFSRERFYSWWRNEYVKSDDVYHVKYNRHGTPVSYRLNIRNNKVRKQMRMSVK